MPTKNSEQRRQLKHGFKAVLSKEAKRLYLKQTTYDKLKISMGNMIVLRL